MNQPTSRARIIERTRTVRSKRRQPRGSLRSEGSARPRRTGPPRPAARFPAALAGPTRKEGSEATGPWPSERRRRRWPRHSRSARGRRTQTCASAENTAPPSTIAAPMVSTRFCAPPRTATRSGQSTISTPTRPRATAVIAEDVHLFPEQDCREDHRQQRGGIADGCHLWQRQIAECGKAAGHATGAQKAAQQVACGRVDAQPGREIAAAPPARAGSRAARRSSGRTPPHPPGRGLTPP